MLLSTKKEYKIQFWEEWWFKIIKYEKKNKQKEKRQNYSYCMKNKKEQFSLY